MAVDARAAECKVLLLGWTGCKLQHLEKYANVYRELGYSPICRNKHSAMSALMNPARMTHIANEVLECVAQEKPVCVHVFSNGGAFLWTHALRLARRKNSHALSSLQGQILDSSPGWFYDLLAGFHFCWEMVRSKLGRFALLLVTPLAIALSIVLYMVTLQWVPALSRQRLWRTEWLQNIPSQTMSQHLLLFSSDDKLIARSSVQEFSEQLAALPGATVSVKEWPQSVHVQHLKLHPVEYKAAVQAFLARLPQTGEPADVHKVAEEVAVPGKR